MSHNGTYSSTADPATPAEGAMKFKVGDRVRLGARVVPTVGVLVDHTKPAPYAPEEDAGPAVGTRWLIPKDTPNHVASGHRVEVIDPPNWVREKGAIYCESLDDPHMRFWSYIANFQGVPIAQVDPVLARLARPYEPHEIEWLDWYERHFKPVPVYPEGWLESFVIEVVTGDIRPLPNVGIRSLPGAFMEPGGTIRKRIGERGVVR